MKASIKHAIKEGRYSSIQDFFNSVSNRLTTTDIANPGVFNKYLSGSVNMKIETLRQICIELHCSADYLLGFTPFNKGVSGNIYYLLHNIDNDIEIAEDLEDYNKTVITYKNKKIAVDNDNLVKDINHILKFYLYDKTHEED